MPRSNSPQYSTYKTEQYSFVKDIFSRSTLSYDGAYINCLVEETGSAKQQTSQAVVKRPGTVTKLSSGSITSEFRGCYFWERQNVLVTAIGANIVVFNPSTFAIVATTAHTMGTTTGTIGFVEYLYSTGEDCLIFSDGNKIGKLSTAYAVTLSTDVDIPTPHNPKLATLDTYIFVIKSNTGDIYNSDVDDPLSWTSGEYISTEMSPDVVVEIAKMSNYLLAFGSNSIEFFYDAQNASGSPLQRNDTFYKNIGYIGGLAQLENKLFFIGKSLNGSIDVYQAEDSKVTALANQQVKRFLSRVPNLSNIQGNLVSVNGNTNYIFTINNITFCIDPTSQHSTQLKYKLTDYFPASFSTTGKSTTLGQVNYLYNNIDNTLISFDYSVYSDSGTNYQFIIRTSNQDMGTLQAKAIGRLSIFCDNNVEATMSLRWSDDDYLTYSNPVTINLKQELPSVRRLGAFRRRAFEFSNTSDQPIRVFGYELDLNMGSS